MQGLKNRGEASSRMKKTPCLWVAAHLMPELQPLSAGLAYGSQIPPSCTPVPCRRYFPMCHLLVLFVWLSLATALTPGHTGSPRSSVSESARLAGHLAFLRCCQEGPTPPGLASLPRRFQTWFPSLSGHCRTPGASKSQLLKVAGTVLLSLLSM